MMDVLTDFSPPLVIRAAEDNLIGAFEAWCSPPLAEFHSGPEGTWYQTGIPFPLLNGVFRAGTDSPSLTENIRSLLARFDDQQLQMTWWALPTDQPEEIGPLLESQGLFFSEAMTGMAVELQSLPETPVLDGLQIETVDSYPAMQTYIDVLEKSYHAPRFVAEAFYGLFSSVGFGPHTSFLHLLGRWNGEPTAIATLYTAAGVAAIFNVGTLPKARRNGLAQALVLTALEAGRKAGYRIGVLFATEMGKSLYHRLGFTELGDLHCYYYMGKDF